MLITIMRGPCISGVQRRRSSASSIWRTLAAGVTCSCASVALPTTPSTARPWRCWKDSTASTSGPSIERRRGRPRREVAERDESLRQQRQARVGLARLQRADPATPTAGQGRQRLLPCRVADELAVARQRLAQAPVERHPRSGLLRRLGQALRSQRRLQVGRGVELVTAQWGVAVVDLPRVDPAPVQVRQVALHRRRQRLVQLRDRGRFRRRALRCLLDRLLQRGSCVVLRLQPVRGCAGEQRDGLAGLRAGSTVVEPEQPIGRSRTAQAQPQCQCQCRTVDDP